ncbi:MAG: hypothetical protein WKH64_13565, partial [Chloroflexia bacterium]
MHPYGVAHPGGRESLQVYSSGEAAARALSRPCRRRDAHDARLPAARGYDGQGGAENPREPCPRPGDDGVVAPGCEDRRPASTDGRSLLDRRTHGRGLGAATDALASPTARTLAVFGTGFQARFQIEAVACVRPLERVQVYSPDQERCERFVAQLRERFRSAGREVEVAAAASARQAASGAEVVCVEPDPLNLEVLDQAAAHAQGRWRVVRAAAGTAAGSMRF